jgi:2-C-methyl-D-erythritol 4-phosphate cytidylyltransferase
MDSRMRPIPSRPTPRRTFPCPVRFFALMPCAGQRQPRRHRRAQAVRARGRPAPWCWHTLSAFAGVKRIARTLVVVAPGDGFFERNPPPRPWSCPCGGATRAASVANGLRELRRAGAVDNDWVLVHDAARCLVTPALIDRLIDACADDEVGGLLAHPLADTLKIEARAGASPPPCRAATSGWRRRRRCSAWACCARRWKARRQVTDESSAIEAMGLKPLLVEAGGAELQGDLPGRLRHGRSRAAKAARLHASCASAKAGTRTRWCPGRKLVLGGVEIPYDRGLLGTRMPTRCCTRSPMRCSAPRGWATSAATSPTPTSASAAPIRSLLLRRRARVREAGWRSATSTARWSRRRRSWRRTSRPCARASPGAGRGASRR